MRRFNRPLPRRVYLPLRVLIVGLMLAALAIPGTIALSTAQTTSHNNAVSLNSLYSPTGLSSALGTSNTTLNWTAAQPNNNGNGNGYAISAVNNGASSTCPTSAASYTSFLAGTTAVTYTDSGSLQSGAVNSWLCYLVQTAFNPAGGPPWASLPVWASVNTLATTKVQLPNDTFTFTITCNGGSCAGWFTASPVSVVISATASRSAVSQISRTLDGTTTNAAAASVSFSVSGDLNHTLTYTATSARGSLSATQSTPVKIDTTPPVISATAVCDQDGNPIFPTTANWLKTGGTYKIYANVTDATSGVATVTADIGKSGLAPFAAGVTLTATSGACAGTTYSYTSATQTAPALTAGTNVVYRDIVATDVAGNVAHSDAAHTTNVSVDNTAPGQPGPGDSGGPGGSGQITLNWSATTDTGGSGVAGYRVDVFISGGALVTRAAVGTSGAACVDSGGGSQAFPCYLFNGVSGQTYDFFVYTVDSAGNLSTAGSRTGRTAP